MATPAIQTELPPSSPPPPLQEEDENCPFIVIGGGIVGLVLALALYKDLGIKVPIYEKASQLSYEIGAGMGMYPNGLRVLRHIDPTLCQKVQEAGYPYLERRYERHDGTTVAVAPEATLSDKKDGLQPIGIKRGRLQKILVQAVQEAGLPLHLGKKVASVTEEEDGRGVRLTFVDGTIRRAQFLFAADGARSQVRNEVLRWKCPEHDRGAAATRATEPETKSEDNESPTNSTESSPSSNLTEQTKKVQLSSTAKQEETPTLYYTGVTCFMGLAPVARPRRGICFPSSLSSKFHAVFFPTAPDEQCFQLHFPVADLTKAMETWGAIPPQDAQKECCALAAQLRIEGWHEDYLKPLENVTYAIRIGFALLQPRLKTWVYGSSQPLVVLLGDAAHPPVPYLGQGAQMGLEDAGTLSLLIKHMCLDIDGQFQATNFRAVTKQFEQMRLARTRQILENSQKWGKIQQQRADDTCRNQAREKIIRREVFFHEALPILFPGATYNYEKAVQEAMARIPIHLAMVKEKEEETDSTSAK